MSSVDLSLSGIREQKLRSPGCSTRVAAWRYLNGVWLSCTLATMKAMSVTWNTPVSSVLSNRRRVGALKALGVATIGDALTYYPFRVTDPVPLKALREARVGQPMAFAAQVEQMRIAPMSARRGYRLEAVVDDGDFARSRGVPGAAATLVFFSGKRPYMQWLGGRLHVGARVVLSATPSEFNGQLQFTHPGVVTVKPNDDADVSGEIALDDKSETGPAPAQLGAHHTFDAQSEQEALQHVSRPRPIYHANSRISSEHIHDSILACMAFLRDVSQKAERDVVAGGSYQEPEHLRTGADIEALHAAIPDILPESVRQSQGLMHRSQALLGIHDPQSTEEFHQAIDSLRFEEAFISQTAVLESRREARKSRSYVCSDMSLRDRFIASLPFSLTDGQRTVIDDISTDLGQEYPMQRLLQGEVGSGKTVVALAAMLQTAGSGFQTVLVAPTQVLAEQHMRTISAMVDHDGLHVPVTLLTGGMKLSARRKALAQAASGDPGIIIATHAAFSSRFQAPRLALVVIDEQHRFGVEQRETLRDRGECIPHLLVMTATPIPRTAAMTWFGDLEISWLTELPSGRKPVVTTVIHETDAPLMARVFAHIRTRIDAGERAYVVCPRIDVSDDDAGESDDGFEGFDEHSADGTGSGIDGGAGDGDDSADMQPREPLHAVTEIAQRLQALPQFKGIAFATLTGRDDDATKARVMTSFADGTTPVLVATTVIEVGVDVPQASCIVIFDADRYGLSQLHQLRGRVGRGGSNSWAFLVSRAEDDSLAARRLEVIRTSHDGAEIAQADLELRGAGDVLGDAQSGGRSGLKLLRVVKDAKLITEARSRAETVLADDPDLAGEVQLAGAVLDFTRGGEAQIASS